MFMPLVYQKVLYGNRSNGDNGSGDRKTVCGAGRETGCDMALGGTGQAIFVLDVCHYGYHDSTATHRHPVCDSDVSQSIQRPVVTFPGN